MPPINKADGLMTSQLTAPRMWSLPTDLRSLAALKLMPKRRVGGPGRFSIR
jgi:hypothetical protein